MLTSRKSTGGGHKEPLYSVWMGMRERCRNPNCKGYSHYGGRGISICLQWRSFVVFQKWAYASGYLPGLTIDRRDNNGNYTPENCRWITPALQHRNKRNNAQLTAFGETKSIAEWLEDSRCVVKDKLLYWRRDQGWEGERAITQPAYAAPAMLTAFGETKTLKQWAADPRCTTSYKVLWQRLKINRMPPEKALSYDRQVAPEDGGPGWWKE